MICDPCKRAGDWNKVTLKPGYEGCRDVAELYHRKCKDGNWCDCQHKIEKAVNDRA